MIYQEQFLRKLTLLKDQGQLRKSQCGGHFLKFVRPLLSANVIVEQRWGSGRRLTVRDGATLCAFIERNFPNGMSGNGLPQRVMGVQRFRDSKAFRSDNPEIVLIRAWQGNVLRRNGLSVDVVDNTNLHSVFSFRMGPAYSVHGLCALIEGPVVFGWFERLGLDVPLAIYYQGRISTQLLNWLERQSQAGFSCLHLPDYDPVGLYDFERVRIKLGLRVRLHLPENLDDLFTRYSKRELLEKRKNQVLLAKARQSECSQIREVVALIDKYNAGLEQEALLIDGDASESSAFRNADSLSKKVGPA
jgi:hypothetical protein